MTVGRSAIEYAFYILIATSIYIAIGAPGLPQTLLQLHSSDPESVPVSQTQIESLVHPDLKLQCPHHFYNIHIFSSTPLVIYIENFVSASEVQHLIDLSESKWQLSTIFNAGEEVHDPTVRNSSKALIDRDNIVQCIEQRALSIQGWPRDTFIERLWTQRYGEGGHYVHHFDWATASQAARRVSSFMVYLAANCTGGGTNFPRMSRPTGEEWGSFLEDEGRDGVDGVTFKAVAGNAVFWMNFDAEGRGYQDTIHAGMPVKSGLKVGLNIWSWYQAGYSPKSDEQREL